MMKNWMRVVVPAVLFAVIGLIALASATLAQGPSQTPPQGGPGTGPGYGMGGRGFGMRGFGVGGPENSLVAVAAKVLGLNQADLIAELNKGKTLADIAKEKGVSTDKIINEFIAQRKAALDAAVKAGRLTQAQADTMLDTIKKNVTTDLTSKWQPGTHGRGMGRGMGGGFVDADKDGICDYAEANGQPGQPGQMMGPRGRWGK